jgi:hypothetical protein
MSYQVASLRQRLPVRRMVRRGMSGLGWDCSQPILRSNYYGEACQLGQGSITEACLARQDQLEQQFVADQQAWYAACSPGSTMQAQANYANTQMAIYGTQVYGDNAAAAQQQAAQFTAADYTAPTVAAKPPASSTGSGSGSGSGSTSGSGSASGSGGGSGSGSASGSGGGSGSGSASGSGGGAGSTPASCFSIFPSTIPGSDPCIGPVGTKTALALAAAVVGLIFAFGGHK